MAKFNFDPLDYFNGEKLIYSGFTQKQKLPIIQIIVLIVISLLTIVLDGFMVGASVVSNSIDKKSGVDILLFVLALCLHLIPESIWAILVLKRIIYEKSKYYVLTEKRLVVIYNLENVETKTIVFKKANNVYVKNGAIVVVFGEGREEEKDYFWGIPQADKAVETIKQNLHSVE